MNNKFRLRQVLTIAKIEMRRAFLSRRGWWVYGLALLPLIMFGGHAIELKVRLQRLNAGIRVAPAVIDSISKGQTEEQVMKLIPQPADDRQWEGRRRVMHQEGKKRTWEEVHIQHRTVVVFDGRRQLRIWFQDGVVQSTNLWQILNLQEDREVFAGMFQYFYLRLAVFFGCLGIFMNLFRGEMLDKTLHYWFLAPARREVLLAGKYLAGLAAAAVIFSGGALLAFGVLLWPHEAAEVQAYMQGPGLAHAFWYATAAALGCVGYGSVFLASGLLLRNPIIPAAIILIWESINSFLPAMLQKLSVLYYLQSLCPVPAPMDSGAPALVRLLLAPAAPASRLGSIVGLLVVTVLVLFAASYAVRRIQISYATE